MTRFPFLHQLKIYMITLIENGEVYGPQPLGQASVLLVDATIQKVGNVDVHVDNDGDPGHLTLSSDAGQSSPTKLLDQIRTCAKDRAVEFSRLLSLVTKNTATALKLADKGTLTPGRVADLLVMDAETLQLKEVIARGKRLLKNGRIEKL